VLWNSKTESITYLPFKLIDDKNDTVSMLRVYRKLNVDKAVGVPPLDWEGREKIYYAGIEEIKATLKANIGFWTNEPFKTNEKTNPKQFLIKSPTADSNIKYINVALAKFKDASLILLRDVFDPRYNIKSKRNKADVKPLEYDPYTAIRGFLKYIGIYAERRGGSLKRNGRILQFDRVAIIDRLIEECLKSGAKKPTPTQVKEAYAWRGCSKPKYSSIRRIIRIVSEELSKQKKSPK
jgi:hypothetical protein